jgi:transposase
MAIADSARIIVHNGSGRKLTHPAARGLDRPAGRPQLRALRHRASLVRLGTQLRNRIHAVAADHGYDRTASYWTGPGGGWLAELDLPPVSRKIITDCLETIDTLAPQIDRLDGEVRARAWHRTITAAAPGRTAHAMPSTARLPLCGCAVI